MNGVMGLVVLGTSIWMAVDASQLGYDKRDLRGLGAMGPTGWFLAGILLWIVAFPLYLVKRGELKAAGDRRRALAAAGFPHGQLPQAGMHGHPGPTHPGMHGHPGPMHPGIHGHPGPMPPGMHGQPGPMHPGMHGQPAPVHPGMHPHGHPMHASHGAQPPVGQPQPQAPTDIDAIVAQIKKLDELRVAGILSDAEFQHKKSELLART